MIIPPAVREELRHPRTPGLVRQWTEHPPDWLRVRKPMRLDLTLKLDRGEVEAIGLAKELRADHVLIDERAGTRVAKAEGLRPLSTLAVLSQAASAGLIDLAKTLHDLQTETTFRLTRRLVDHLLEKERERKRRETPS